MAKLENFTIRPYLKGDNKCSFSCGITDLDRYFKNILSQDIKRSQTAGYVLWDEKAETVAGYFTVSATHIVLSEVPEEHRKKLPYNEVPFILVGRLAIDENYKGRGLGRTLLIAVFELTCNLQKQLGVWGLAVDPINQDAIDFYSKFDFVQVKSDRRMFLSIQTIKKLF